MTSPRNRFVFSRRPSKLWLVARREIVSRYQQRGYRIGLAIAVVLAALASALPAAFGGGHAATRYDVAVAGTADGLPTALRTVGAAQQVRITVHRTSPQQARADVSSGDVDAAVLSGRTIVADHSSDRVVTIVQAAHTLATTLGRLHAAGLTATQAGHALQVRPLPVRATSSPQDSQRQAIAIITVIVLFSQLITFCSWVGSGVVEEKASRVVELLLSSLRPVQLLAGKLIGIGVLAAVQVVLLAGAALVAARLSGTLTLPVGQLGTVAISFVAFLLGFAFFAAVAAGLASTVSRQEEVSGVLAPVSVGLMICYGAGFAVASNADSAFARVISVVPPLSAIAMPARLSRGGVSVFEIVLAVALLVAATAAVLAIAARIYRASILHTGSRLRLRDVWQREPAAQQV